jgi:hypothetical protein
MSNNAPDYENNLAFPPRHDETAYELQLKVNKLEKENTQLRKWCEEFNALDVAKENQQLKELLKEWMYFYPIILYEHEDTLKTKDIVELFDKTREVLK